MNHAQKPEPLVAPLLPANPLEPDDPRYRAFDPDSSVIPPGSRFHGGKPTTVPMLVERDVSVPLRDGAVIYTDVFRPVGDAPVPALVAWSPYGKHNFAAMLDHLPGRGGIAVDRLSNLQKFEGPDPDEWVARGYAVVNPDPRGINASDGDIQFWGKVSGRDSADLVEWAAGQPWSNGAVGMTGNSWLAIMQWFTASERPEGLKAIAPWEGMSDWYRNMGQRGGIPTGDTFVGVLQANMLRGRGRIEDNRSMIAAHPLWNEYWDNSRADIETIQVPAYVVASWTQLHSEGTLDAFERLATTEKWLRVHNTHEWPDYYDSKYVDDLARFFDRYLKGIDNGWEETPRVRLSVLNPGSQDDVNRAEGEWPLARAEDHRLNLDLSKRILTEANVAEEQEIRYPAQGHSIELTYTFEVETEITGYLMLRLSVEADGSNDMDLFVLVDKLGRDGQVLAPRVLGRSVNVSTGQLRVSHRAVDQQLSRSNRPVLAHVGEDLLSPGEVVPVDIALLATSARWGAGEALRLTISGDRIVPSEAGAVSELPLRNAGDHILHSGGMRDSYLSVPTVPPPKNEK